MKLIMYFIRVYLTPYITMQTQLTVHCLCVAWCLN